MAKMSVKLFRNVENMPSIVEITKDNRKVTATFDPDTGLFLEGPGGMLPSIAEILQMEYPFSLPFASRPAWYDRNPKNVGEEYDATVAAHATTERLTYTVPVDRICMIEMLSIMAIRQTASAGNNYLGVKWRHTPAGGSEEKIMSMYKYGNTIGDSILWTIGGTITLFSGDKLRMTTEDQPNAGGGVVYECAFKGTEFDA